MENIVEGWMTLLLFAEIFIVTLAIALAIAKSYWNDRQEINYRMLITTTLICVIVGNVMAGLVLVRGLGVITVSQACVMVCIPPFAVVAILLVRAILKIAEARVRKKHFLRPNFRRDYRMIIQGGDYDVR